MAKRSRVRDTVWTVVALILFTQACHQAIDPTGPTDDERPRLPSGFSADAWFVEDFESYGSVSGNPTEDFRDNSTGWWLDRLSSAHSEIVNDAILGRIWRQHNTLRTLEDCQPGGGTGRVLRLPHAEKEIWVEAFVRLGPTYKTQWPEPECGTGDHKFIFWERANSREGSTWRFKIGNQGSGFRMKAAVQDYGNLYSEDIAPVVGHGDLPNPCMNDVWMRWRWHLRGASIQGTPDGHYEWRWVELDDPNVVYYNPCVGREMKYLARTPTDQHDGFVAFELGKTFNGGPLAPQYWEYGEIRVWRANPGWGW